MNPTKQDYFDGNEKLLIKTMLNSNIGRQGRRGLARKLFGPGSEAWKKYVEIEKEVGDSNQS